jgi:hypothetical protein
MGYGFVVGHIGHHVAVRLSENLQLLIGPFSGRYGLHGTRSPQSPQRGRAPSANRRAAGRSFPIEIRPDIGALLAAGLARKPRFEIGEPDIIRPSVAVDCRPMAAAKIRAINQETANASGAHLGEGDLLVGSFGHAAIEARTSRPSNAAHIRL